VQALINHLLAIRQGIIVQKNQIMQFITTRKRNLSFKLAALMKLR